MIAADHSDCWCTTCRPVTMEDMRFVVCPTCGNKRCPRAHNHAMACTNSNEPGQPGSSWEHVRPARETVVYAPRRCGKTTALNRALLELAAKAAGVLGVYQHWEDSRGSVSCGIAPNGSPGRLWWNQLTDEGD